MIRSQLIAKLAAENPHLSRGEAERVVASVLDRLTEALAAGRRVELRGFGAFSVRVRPPRAGRHPRPCGQFPPEAPAPSSPPLPPP